MANHKSAAKRARQSVKRKARNSDIRVSVRTVEKKLRKALETKDAKVVSDLLKGFMKRIDKAAQKGILHKNAAARKVASLSKRVSEIVKG